jgi:glycosyltransferase involved in cell wall biosynthesis
MKRTIGTLTFKHYGAMRNIMDLPFESYRFETLFSWARARAYAQLKLLKRQNLRQEFLFNNDFVPTPGVGLQHFFNLVSSSKTPWISTFESYIPYWHGPRFKKDTELLVRDACKRIIPISAYAQGILRSKIEAVNPTIWPQVEQRLQILHPPQQPVIGSISEKPFDPNRLSIVLVGSFFFNKGGLPILRVADRLIREGLPLQLYIISSMTWQVWNETCATQADYDEAMRLIGAHPANIHFHQKLPNADVLQILKHADIGLLPSVGDTYGYSVLEAQSAGCPVITTDAFAFTEVNDTDRGWIIPVAKDGLLNPLLKTGAERNAALEAIDAGLDTILRAAFHDREGLRRKGAAALKHVTAHHAAERNAAILTGLYDTYYPA